MRLAGAFVLKLLATFAAVYFVALFFPLLGSVNIVHAMLLSIAITVLGFVTDLIVPRAVNNIVAVMMDFGLAALVTFLLQSMLPGMRVSDTFAIFVGLLVAGVEIFIHNLFFQSTTEPRVDREGL
jgi:hypothetical protein